jgi:hypothetical protein
MRVPRLPSGRLALRAQGGQRFPHGTPACSEVESRLSWAQEIVGSIPTTLTIHGRGTGPSSSRNHTDAVHSAAQYGVGGALTLLSKHLLVAQWKSTRLITGRQRFNSARADHGDAGVAALHACLWSRRYGIDTRASPQSCLRTPTAGGSTVHRVIAGSTPVAGALAPVAYAVYALVRNTGERGSTPRWGTAHGLNSSLAHHGVVVITGARCARIAEARVRFPPTPPRRHRPTVKTPRWYRGNPGSIPSDGRISSSW